MRVLWWYLAGLALTVRWWFHLPQKQTGYARGFAHFYCAWCHDTIRAKHTWFLDENGCDAVELIVHAKCPAALAIAAHHRRRP